jgi:cytochrome c-type biogenesis protein CcmE
MTRKQYKLTWIGVIGTVLALSVGLVLFALRDQIVFFYTPSDVVSQSLPPETKLRLGGLVKEGSIVGDINVDQRFAITDGTHEMQVSYQGILPDLFREGQGVVVEGMITQQGYVKAHTVLAKHDETYMPREVMEALKEQGVWKDGALIRPKGSGMSAEGYEKDASSY